MFFQAILLFPDVQRKAKEEIDSVIGFERVVNFDDQPSLPYMEALYREVLRWKQVLPLSVAHASTMDDTFKGYYIRKGANLRFTLYLQAHVFISPHSQIQR